MRNKNLLVIFALASLMAMAGVGMWLIMDGGTARAADKPVVPGRAR
ncbi:MAG: hypothetical protein KF754_00865 [Planctomycetes bacterium]|nr:hypothetical protein [Planctomycetota bacterium]